MCATSARWPAPNPRARRARPRSSRWELQWRRVAGSAVGWVWAWRASDAESRLAGKEDKLIISEIRIKAIIPFARIFESNSATAHRQVEAGQGWAAIRRRQVAVPGGRGAIPSMRPATRARDRGPGARTWAGAGRCLAACGCAGYRGHRHGDERCARSCSRVARRRAASSRPPIHGRMPHGQPAIGEAVMRLDLHAGAHQQAHDRVLARANTLIVPTVLAAHRRNES